MKPWDVVILGAGASGLFCAFQAAARGKKVLVFDHQKSGRKILASGGGKCNFSNLEVDAVHYLSENPHFVKSALSRYSQWDFIDLLQKAGISYEERNHGRLFCAGSAQEILNLLLKNCSKYGVEIQNQIRIQEIKKTDHGFEVSAHSKLFSSESLVVATGGISFPQLQSSDLGYIIAKQFGVGIIPPSAGLCPLLHSAADRKKFGELSGIAVEAKVSLGKVEFQENLLFTHRGLSGPAILQISNYFQKGDEIQIDFIPGVDLVAFLEKAKSESGNLFLSNILSRLLPKRVVNCLCPSELLKRKTASLKENEVTAILKSFSDFTWIPEKKGSLQAAEITLGGVDTDFISSKTFETKKVPGLFFIGEVLDVSGNLGGYNLQWAWSSGFCAAQYV